MRMTRPLTILALLAILPAPVLGQSNTAVESAYTTFDSDTCRRTPVEDYGSWLCRGYGDIPVRLAAGVPLSRVRREFARERAVRNRLPPLAVSTRVKRVERLFGLAPKGRFVSVQPFKCAAI
jgi:hypothetical protein